MRLLFFGNEMSLLPGLHNRLRFEKFGGGRLRRAVLQFQLDPPCLQSHFVGFRRDLIEAAGLFQPDLPQRGRTRINHDALLAERRGHFQFILVGSGGDLVEHAPFEIVGRPVRIGQKLDQVAGGVFVMDPREKGLVALADRF